MGNINYDYDEVINLCKNVAPNVESLFDKLNRFESIIEETQDNFHGKEGDNNLNKIYEGFSNIIGSTNEVAGLSGIGVKSKDIIDIIYTEALNDKAIVEGEEANNTLFVEGKSQGGNINGKDLTDFASQFVGTPYVWGGSNLDKGVDCSGFVQEVYKHFGIDVPRYSGATRTVGIEVASINDANPGDIICFDGHVGIYYGNNQMIHSIGSQAHPEWNKGVEIRSMDRVDEPIITIRRVI